MLFDYDFHPPDDVRLFRIPWHGVLLDRPEVLVYEVAVHDMGFRGQVVLRHYAFADKWFKVNVCLDLEGCFFDEESLPHPFCFNCDVSTPMLRRGDAVYAVDLWLDVLVRADGRTHVVVDEDQLREARAGGLLSAREADGARRGLAELVDLASSGRLIGHLHAIHPFGHCSGRPRNEPPMRLSDADVPEVRAHSRLSW